MKTYVGKRLDPHGCEVYVRTEDGRSYPLPLRLEVRNHSPTGFEWGYGGSGPAQLALAILCDHYGPSDPPSRCPFCDNLMDGPKCPDWRHCRFDWDKSEDKWGVVTSKPGHYQDFKADIIAKLPRHDESDRLSREPWEITSQQIDDWIASKILAAGKESKEFK